MNVTVLRCQVQALGSFWIMLHKHFYHTTHLLKSEPPREGSWPVKEIFGSPARTDRLYFLN